MVLLPLRPVRLPKAAEQDKSRRISIGGASGRAGETADTGERAIGKDWMKEARSEEGEVDKEQAETGQDTPA